MYNTEFTRPILQSFIPTFSDARQPDLPGGPRRGDGVRVDGPHLPEHPAGAHNHERRLGSQDARAEVQLPGHGGLESMAGQGARHTGLR